MTLMKDKVKFKLFKYEKVLYSEFCHVIDYTHGFDC
jgi:hypothetical protein